MEVTKEAKVVIVEYLHECGLGALEVFRIDRLGYKTNAYHYCNGCKDSWILLPSAYPQIQIVDGEGKVIKVLRP